MAMGEAIALDSGKTCSGEWARRRRRQTVARTPALRPYRRSTRLTSCDAPSSVRGDDGIRAQGMVFAGTRLSLGGKPQRHRSTP
jgi:hypothetical protein